MAYDKFTVLKSPAVPLPMENVDTDQIIPARFLKATKREGFGDNLFRDWRYNTDGSPKQDFVLNNSIYSGEILVAEKILEVEALVNMLLGRFTIMDFVVSSLVSLQIFSRTIQ